MVSSSTPNATAKPNSTSTTSGRTASAENVAASTMPAEVITPPVTASPAQHPGRVPRRDRLLAYPAHQEDVVVDAEGDQEDEGEQRERRVHAGEAEDVRGTSARRRPRVATNDSTTVAISSSGASSARSSRARITAMTTSTTGMITFRSRVAASEVSTLIAVKPPTTASAPGTACTASRSVADGPLGAVAVGRGRPGSPPAAPARRPPSAAASRLRWAGLRAGRRGGPDVGDPGHALRHLGDLPGGLLGGEDGGRAAGAGRVVPGDHLLAVDRVGALGEQVGLAEGGRRRAG